ncbi:rplV [Mucuna pruriens]|uniref:Large ribosomal subunit protein uL22c n=1 Tax=Mucuna pruriens TaxID=157652 RepID=A0A371FY16_MUCPR|nr:rplV [Mucuna pruriens]
MVQWQRHIFPFLRRIHKGVVDHHALHSPPNLVISRLASSLSQGHFGTRPWTTTFPSFSRPLYLGFQHQGISSSTWLLANSSEETPVLSPLAPVSLLDSSKGEDQKQKAVTKKEKVQAILKGIKQSPKKVNLVAALVRGMLVKDALMQLQLTIKRAAKTVYQVIHSAQANASHNHGLDPERLIVVEAFVGKGYFKKRVSYHAKGKSGIRVRPECRLTVVVREITAEEEADIARLRVHNFKKLTKREKRLVPHQLIETTPIWGRKSKSSAQNLSAAPA